MDDQDVQRAPADTRLVVSNLPTNGPIVLPSAKRSHPRIPFLLAITVKRATRSIKNRIPPLYIKSLFYCIKLSLLSFFAQSFAIIFLLFRSYDSEHKGKYETKPPSQMESSSKSHLRLWQCIYHWFTT